MPARAGHGHRPAAGIRLPRPVTGAWEIIATALTLRDGIAHPTINLDEPDPLCDLDYIPEEARRIDARVAVKTSFGFGGQNAALVLRACPF